MSKAKVIDGSAEREVADMGNAARRNAVRERLTARIRDSGDLFGESSLALLAGPAHAMARMDLLQMTVTGTAATPKSVSLPMLRAALYAFAGPGDRKKTDDPDEQNARIKEWMEGPPEIEHDGLRGTAPADRKDVKKALELAHWVAARLAVHGDGTFTSRDLLRCADKIYGGTLADGAYTIKDAYDAMECGVNLALMSPPARLPVSGEDMAALLEKLRLLLTQLPTQTSRTPEMEAYQQFSTPPTLAAAACWCAAAGPTDACLEPSAGTGAIAVFAQMAGARLILNELSPRRAALLQALFPQQPVWREDATQIHYILPEDDAATVAIMNPPFSSAAGRLPSRRDTLIGARHVEQALLRLQPGGRLVSYAGAGMGPERKSTEQWWNRIRRQYSVRANIGIAGALYAKYGTSCDMRLLVIDKCGPTSAPEVRSGCTTLTELLSALAPLRALRAPANAGGRFRVPGADPASAPHSEVRAAPRCDVDGAAQHTNGCVAASAGASVVAPPPTSAGAPPRPDGASILTDAVFEEYTPQTFADARALPHPGLLVQSAAMAAVEAPRPSYRAALPAAVLREGRLSLAQYEAVVYAGEAHAGKLASGERRGFFIGDGTGVGKGRCAAGIILDNQCHGRTKAVWISERGALLLDARRDMAGVGGDPSQLFAVSSARPQDAIERASGVAFLSYKLLASGESARARQGGGEPLRTRLSQLTGWLGAGFDGVIVFDESHNMANCFGKKGARGQTRAAAMALAGLELQRLLPEARVVYISATGATEVANLRYLARLGLWGAGTPFADAGQFVAAVTEGGVAAMELVSRDMKALGLYVARSLSYEGVSYERLLHRLTPLQTDIYDELAGIWQRVLGRVNEALKITGQAHVGAAKSATLARFWGTHQRFFAQIITSLQMPTVLARAREEIALGNAVVMQLVNTNEASQERQLTNLAQADGVLDDLDFTPREDLTAYVRNGFPVNQYESYEDAEGRLQWRQVLDAAGRPVINTELVKERDRLVATLTEIRVPDNPIDMIVNAFGADNVAEVTGRRRRFVLERDEAGDMRPIEQRRSAALATADAQAFMDDRMRVLVYSDAGGTGYSFHADRTRRNQRRRVHFLIQPGWRADKAVQGLGRTHRTNEASQPHYILPTTDLQAQRRFVSSIARRLDQLGALTKGQRQTASQGLFTADDNLESDLARRAMRIMFRDMYHGCSPLDFNDTTEAMGLHGLIDAKTGSLNESKLPTTPRFLNRLLSLRTAEQDRVFGVFYAGLRHLVAMARQEDSYDQGVETIRALAVDVVQEAQIHADARTGAATVYVQLELTQPSQFTDYEALPRGDAGPPEAAATSCQLEGYFRHKASGAVVAVYRSGTSTDEAGNMITRGRRYTPTGPVRYLDDIAVFSTPQYARLGAPEARRLWKREAAAAPETYKEMLHLITGVLLPIWDRLAGRPQVVRTQTTDGRRLLGRVVRKSELASTLANLGVSGFAPTALGTPQLKSAVLGGGKAVLSNGWELRCVRVRGQKRIELEARSITASEVRGLEAIGLFRERIGWQDRLFVPIEGRSDTLGELVAEHSVATLYPANAGL